MPGETEGGSGDRIGCKLKVGFFVHDDGIFSAHFGNDAFDPFLPRLRFGCPFVDSQSDIPRAREADEPGKRMIHEVIADLPARSRQIIDDPRRQAHFFEQSYEFRRDDLGVVLAKA